MSANSILHGVSESAFVVDLSADEPSSQVLRFDEEGLKEAILQQIDRNAPDLTVSSDTRKLQLVVRMNRLTDPKSNVSYLVLVARLALQEKGQLSRDPPIEALVEVWSDSPLVHFFNEDVPDGLIRVAMASKLLGQMLAFLEEWRMANPVEPSPGDASVAEINGIGSVFQRRLEKEGILTIADLARLSDGEVELLMQSLGDRLNDWVQEAKDVVGGD